MTDSAPNANTDAAPPVAQMVRFFNLLLRLENFDEAVTAIRKGDLDLALFHLETAVELEPDNRLYRANLRRLLARINDKT